MNTLVQESEVSGALGVEYDENGCPVGISVEELFDKLDKRLLEHYGEDFRNRVNASRQRWNEKGVWHFDML